MPPRKFDIAYKKAQVAQCEATGVTLREFATTNKIAYSTFCRWWRKYRTAPRRARGRGRTRHKDELVLVEVQVVDDAGPPPMPQPQRLELELPGGHPLRFDVGMDPNYIAALIAATGKALQC